MIRRIITVLAAITVCSVMFAKENATKSPNGKYEAYTEGGNLYIEELETGKVTAVTKDGSDLILNGYASWVYYEEIFGRSSNYKAFWWSPDSKKLAFYRFDNSGVEMFPIYSEEGQYGSLTLTRYPKAGTKNPDCRIGIFNLSGRKTIWAKFDYEQDLYFGTPFFKSDSKALYVQKMPRVQNSLDLVSVSVSNGRTKHIYHESYPTWVDWMDDMLFGKKGLYMARAFESGWQQIYYLSYDGKTLKRLTDGKNWRISLLYVNEKTQELYYTAHRDSDIRKGLYKRASDGSIKLLTPEDSYVEAASIEDDGLSFRATLSNVKNSRYTVCGSTDGIMFRNETVPVNDGWIPNSEFKYITMAGNLKVPIKITYPDGFGQDTTGRRYPVIMEVYGGPDTDYVKDRWRAPRPMEVWCARNGIIKVVADCRASGHNGRAGEDLVYKDMVSVPIEDFCKVAEYLGTLPYVDKERIGVEGFSFGGTMTAMLVMRRSDLFRCGIAGGGVYDWTLYDSHYTERFMNTPQNNLDGYEKARVMNYVKDYNPQKAMLKLTHGTADDNVHFQNTLQLVKLLQEEGKQFELMIYPGGMHGYRGKQSLHDNQADQIFWQNYLTK